MTDLTNLTPAEIDTELARIWNETAKFESYAARIREHLAMIDAGKTTDFSYRIESDRKTLAKYETEIAALADEARPYEAEYRARGGWNRYFLVTNTNGHVHRGMNCSTCFDDTRYSWIVDLADCDEDAMVEEWGERACTVCFPDAPTNPAFARPARIDREAKEARAAEKAARDAAKAEKAITAPDGSPLRTKTHGYTETYATKVAARNALSSAVQSFAFYGSVAYVEEARILAEALEAAGIETAPVIDRAAKRAAKDGAEHTFPGLS